MKPSDLVLSGVAPDVALKVHVVALFDVLRIERAAQVERHLRRVCKQKKRSLFTSISSTRVKTNNPFFCPSSSATAPPCATEDQQKAPTEMSETSRAVKMRPAVVTAMIFKQLHHQTPRYLLN